MSLCTSQTVTYLSDHLEI